MRLSGGASDSFNSLVRRKTKWRNEMKADKELMEYIEKRAKHAKEQEDKYEPNGDDRFKHILYMGESSAFRELLGVLNF